MNHSRKKIILAIFLSIVVFVGGSLSALAKPPVKVTLYGVTYGTSESAAYHNMRIMPVSNNIFGVYTDGSTYNQNTLMRFYFGASVDSIESFTLSIKKLGTTIETDKSLGLSSYTIQLITLNSAGTVTAFENIRASTQSSYTEAADGSDVYNWRWVSTTGSRSFNSILVTVCFYGFMLSTNPVYFELLDLSVNGEETVFSPYESNMLSAVQGIEQAINDDSDLPIDTDDIPAAPDTSSINSGTQTGIGYINDFVDEFATGGAVGRVLLPISTYLTVADSFNDNSTGHRMITIIFKLGCGLVIIGFIINGIKRRGDFT